MSWLNISAYIFGFAIGSGISGLLLQMPNWVLALELLFVGIAGTVFGFYEVCRK